MKTLFASLVILAALAGAAEARVVCTTYNKVRPSAGDGQGHRTTCVRWNSVTTTCR